MGIDKETLVLLFLIAALRESDCCFDANKSSNRTIKSGDTFYQECICADKESVDSLIWLDPQGQEIVNGPGTQSVVFTERSDRGVSLYISYVSKSRSGTYSCVAESDGERYTFNYHLRAYDPLYFVDPVQSQIIIKGEDSIIRCEARGETEPLMNWYKGTGDDMVQLSDDEKFEIGPEGLKVRQVDAGDAGDYRCTALVLETGEEGENLISVEVLTKPFIEAVVAKPDRTVVIGDALSIECSALGVPTPEYRWNKTSEENSKNLLEWPKNTKKLEFHSVKADDRGVYECAASNRAGSVREEVTIEVFIPPKIKDFKSVTGAEGSIVHVICDATGRPAPIVNIQFEDNLDLAEISVMNQNLSETENRLVVSFFNLSRHYDGVYLCIATNEVGNETKAATVTVQYQPYCDVDKALVWGWKGLAVNLSCPCEGNPPAEIQWWYQTNTSRPDLPLTYNSNKQYLASTVTDSSYGIYKCIAKNYLGNSTKTISLSQAFVPPAVTNITVLEKTASSIHFEINLLQEFQGPEVIGFIAEYDEAKNYDVVSIHPNRFVSNTLQLNRSWAINVPFRVEKLKPMTQYRFKFAAINALGHGNWSQPFDIDTPDKSVPETPMWLENSISDETGNLNMRWKIPDSNGEPIDAYFLEYCPVIGADLDEEKCNIVEIEPHRTEFDFKPLLESNTTYEILITAHNSLGNSSAARRLVTVPESYSQSLSAEVVVGLSALAVVASILALDLALFCWRRQGMVASCYYRNQKKNEDNTLSRDKKGLLRDNKECAADDSLTGAGNGEKFPRTGLVAGKHTSV